jgi:molybdate transport system permease protein
MDIDLSPLFLSLATACTATVVTFFCGIWAARLVLRLRRIQWLFDTVFTLPLVLPPSVVGFFLLSIFGSNSFLGKLLSQVGFPIVFSWYGTVAASIVVSFPLLYRTVKAAFAQTDANMIAAAKTLGLHRRTIFWRIILPNQKHSVFAGTILAFARALGEFGATIMVAGNIPGKTQTMAVAVYSAVQAGNRPLAYFWTILICCISLLFIGLLSMAEGKSKKGA